MLLVLEALVLLWGIAGLLRGSRTVAELRDMNVTLGAGAQTDGGQYVMEEGGGYTGDFLEADGFTLTPGVYRLELTADSADNDVNSLGMACDDEAIYSLLSNAVPIYSGQETTVCEFYVTRTLDASRGLRAYVEYNGTQALAIEELRIVRTAQGSSILLFVSILLFGLADSLMMLYAYLGKYPVRWQRLAVWFGIPTLAVLASLPIFTDYAITGADSVYHWGRIEALATDLRAGIIPVRVASRWLYGHGYASSLFYPDLFLTVPALFRIIGFPLTTAYNMYIFVVNLATAVIAYVSFRGIFDDERIGLLGSLLYTLAPYRVYNIYNRSAVGEYTAMIFLPLLCWGFYRIFTDDISERRYRYSWIIPTLGFTGIIQSHLLSCEIMGAMTILLCVLLIRRVLRRQTFLTLVKAVLATAALNLWYIVPCLDMMVSGEYYYSNNANVYVQDRGTVWAALLSTWQASGASSKYAEYGMVDGEPIGVGIAVLIGVAAFLILRRGHSGSERERNRDRAGLAALVIGCVGWVLSSVYFPWDAIKDTFPALGGLVSMIQFPTRLTMVPAIAGVFASCVAVMWALRRDEALVRRGFCTLIVGAAVLFSLYQTNDTLMTKSGYLRIYSANSIGNSGILGAEYLPLGVDYPSGFHEAEGSEGVEILSFVKQQLSTETEVRVQDAEGSYYVELPMLYYKGYQVREQDEGISVGAGDNGHVRVTLPAGYAGMLHVSYDGMWYWHVSEAVSAAALLALVGYGILRRRGSKRAAEGIE